MESRPGGSPAHLLCLPRNLPGDGSAAVFSANSCRIRRLATGQDPGGCCGAAFGAGIGCPQQLRLTWLQLRYGQTQVEFRGTAYSGNAATL